jgi:putative PEP-CTERM system TPR-repeat lipoprotein
MTSTGVLKVRRSLLGSATVWLGFAVVMTATTPAANAAINPGGAAGGMSPDVTALLTKAEQALQQGHPDIAIIYLKNGESIAPNVGAIHFDLGQALLATNNPSEAERELNIALQKSVPQNKVLPQLFQAMLAQHKGALLLDRYPEPAESDKTTLASDILRARAFAYLQNGRKSEAAASLERALTIARTAQNLAARAQLSADMGDSTRANTLIDEALVKEPANGQALMIKIALLQRANQQQQALAYANRLVIATKGQALATLTRASVYLGMKQVSKALSDVDATLAQAPNAPLAIFYKAIIEAQSKDPKGAWVLAQTLPHDFLASRADVGVSVGQMAIAAGQRETGAEILHTTVQAFPGNADARIRLAAVYILLNEQDQAVQTLNPILNSSDPRVSALMAQISVTQKDYGRSLQYLQKASENGYGGDSLKLRLATAAIEQGRLEDARILLQALNTKQPNRAEVVGPLILTYLKKGDFGSASKIAEGFSAGAPKNPFAPFYQGQIAGEKGDTEAAIAFYSAAIGRDPKFSPAFLNRGTAYLSRGEFDRARGDFQAAITANSRNTLASLRLAALLRQLGQDDKALDILKSGAAASPGDISVWSALEEFYAIHNRWAEASATAASFLKNSPNNPSALALQASVQIATGTPDAAITTLNGLLKTYPHAQDTYLSLARAYQKKGDTASAQATLRKAIIDRPKAPAAHAALIKIDFVANDQQAALRDAKAFADNAPGPDSAQMLASVLSILKRNSEAESILQESLSTSPDLRSVIQLSTLLRADGNQRGANSVLSSWLEKHPKDGNVRQAYAVALMSDNPSMAEQQMRLLLKENAFNVGALNNLAWLITGKDLKAAHELGLRALKLAPDSPAVLDTNGWILWKMSDRAGAATLLQRAHAGAPSDLEIAFHLATVLVSLNRQAEAQKLLGPVLAKGNDFPEYSQARKLMQGDGRKN